MLFRILGMQSRNILSIACGSAHCLAVAVKVDADDGKHASVAEHEVWAWGVVSIIGINLYIYLFWSLNIN